MRRDVALALILAVATAAMASAEVRIGVRPDGTKVIYNESSAQRTRRMANDLVAVPESTTLELIEDHASRQSLDPRLVQAVVQVESGYNERAVSNKGAMGLMQLMPGTARLMAVKDPYDPDENLRGGTSYLRAMLDRFAGRLELALAAYNAGPEAVAKYGGIPPYAETEAYVDRVLRLFNGTGLSMAIAERVGRPVFLSRDAQNRLVLSTFGRGRP